MAKVNRALRVYREEGGMAVLRKGWKVAVDPLVSRIRWVDYSPDEYGTLARHVVGYRVGQLLGERLSYALSLRRLRRRMADEGGLDDIVETAFDFGGFGRYNALRPMQIRDELSDLAERAAECEPETVLEIGTARGGSFYVWCRWLDSASTFVSLDLPGSHGEKDPGFLRAFTDSEVVTVRGDSHDPATRDRVAEAVDGTVDFLFIDGDHSYEGVKSDFEMYGSLVGDGGMIALHDVDHAEGVETFWREIQKEYETETISYERDKISDPGHTCGIGVVHR